MPRFGLPIVFLVLTCIAFAVPALSQSTGISVNGVRVYNPSGVGSPTPVPFPSFSPASVAPHVVITPSPAPTTLPTGTVTSGQAATYGCKTSCVGENWIHLGVVDGTVCTIVAAIYDHEPATSTVITSRPDEDGCSPDWPGDALLAPTAGQSPQPIIPGQIAQQQDTYTSWVLNGVSTPINAGYTGLEWTFSRGSGTSFYFQGNQNGHDLEWIENSYTLAAVQSGFLGAYATVHNFLGSFWRDISSPPFGALQSYNIAIAPSPYPTAMTSASPANLASFCTTVAANSLSIVSANPTDYQKLKNLVAAGVQWTRTGISPALYDISHMAGAGIPSQQVAFAPMDSANCGELMNGVEPIVEIDAGQINYGTYLSYAGPYYSGTSNPIYKSPADYATWCTTVAQHDKTYFPEIRRFEIPYNENNGGWTATQVALTNNPAAYLGMPGLIAYSQQCYHAIKAVDPTYFVYWGEVNMDPGASPLQFIQQMYQGGCRIGTCFDGISIHMEPYGNAGAYYDPAIVATTWPGGPLPGWVTYGPTIKAFQALANSIVSDGETQYIHFLVSESDYRSTPSAGAQQGSEADQAWMWSNDWLYYAEAQLACGSLAPSANFCVDGLSAANIDEDALYIGSTFANTGLIDTSETLQRARPALAAYQIAAGVNPSAPPTMVPGSTTATPYPSATPQLDAIVRAFEPTAYFRMNEATGSTAADVIANYNGTYVGAVTPGAAAALTINDTVAPAFAFASNGAVTTNIPPTVPALNGAYFTCGFSVSLTQAPYGQNVCSNDYTASTGLGTQTYWDNTGVGHLVWCLGLTTSGTTCITSGVGHTTGTTYRIIEVFNGIAGTMTIYENGNVIASATGKYGTIKPTTYSVYVDGSPNSAISAYSQISGTMAEFYFGPFAETSPQIAADYLAATGNPVPTPAPSPTFVQGATSNGTSTTLATAPPNGDVMVGIGFGESTYLHDSNGLSYPSQAEIQNGDGNGIQMFAGTVSGSPTNVFSFSLGSSQIEGLLDFRNMTLPGVYATATSISSGNSLTATASSASPYGALVVCAIRVDANDITGVTIANSSDQVTFYTNNSAYYIVYGHLNFAGDAACTATFSATGLDPSMVLGAFP